MKKKKEVTNYKDFYLDASSIDIFDFKYDNEIITNLKGLVKNSRLYLDENRFIKLYAKNRDLLPKNGEYITILRGHLASYKGNKQIIIHNLSDYKIGN